MGGLGLQMLEPNKGPILKNDPVCKGKWSPVMARWGQGHRIYC